MQNLVVVLFTKADYVAATRCCAQVLWIKSQLADYDILYDKVPIFCDDTSAIAISNNPVLHSRTKHIDIKYQFIRDHILKGDIELHFVPTDLQLADIFTKLLVELSFTRLVAELGMLNIDKVSLPSTMESYWWSTKTLYTIPCLSFYPTVAFLLLKLNNLLRITQNTFGNNDILLRLKYNYDSLPSKENVRAGLASLGCIDDKNPHLTPTNLINSSPLRIKYFLPIWRVWMTYVVKCLGVANLSTKHEKTLILSTEEVNADNTTNKSLSKIVVQSVVQPKVTTGRMYKKKKIPSSFEPKTSHYVKQSKSKETVADTQHVEESMVTANTTQRECGEEKGYPQPNRELESAHSYPIFSVHSESASESDTLRFITPDVDPENSRHCKDLQHPAHESQTLRVPKLNSASKVVECEEEDPLAVDSRLWSLGATDLDLAIKEADSDVESVHDDEILSIFGDDNREDDSDRELSVVDEVVADTILDEIIN
ncbi:hypothetical protein Tco_0943214 [Tanacetum coccineum]